MGPKTRIWLGLGAAILVGSADAGAAPASPASVPDNAPAAPPARSGYVQQLAAAEDPTTGELPNEGAGPVSEFRLNSTDPNAYNYDASAQVAAYPAGIYDRYAAALADGEKMQTAINGLLASPTQQTLDAARGAWLTARRSYMQTEVFRFSGGPIDGEGPEPRMNGWPVNEAFIDRVINDAKAKIGLDTIISVVPAERERTEDDNTTGWHAIEYLLWGQDRNPNGPGARPVADFVAGQGANDHRRDYLSLATLLLVNDLSTMVTAWSPDGDNYRSTFKGMDKRNVIGRAFVGMATLAGYELALKRLSVGLGNGGAEDEQSRYSDSTNDDLINAIRGVRNVYFADGKAGAGFDALMARVDPALNTRIVAELTRAEAAAAAIDSPYDRVLASPEGSPARAKAQAAVAALRDLGVALRTAGNKLGVLVSVPGL